MIEIALFTTGGTIDGADADSGASCSRSSAADWLATRHDVASTHYVLFNKDSREISTEERHVVIQAVKNCTASLVLITHGTFTIAETGRALKAALPETTKTILLVGSWSPFGSASTDAPQQMEYALEILRKGHPGVYIAMDGRLFNPDTTEKREFSPGKFVLADNG